jgi:hypothetical protein
MTLTNTATPLINMYLRLDGLEKYLLKIDERVSLWRRDHMMYDDALMEIRKMLHDVRREVSYCMHELREIHTDKVRMSQIQTPADHGLLWRPAQKNIP